MRRLPGFTLIEMVVVLVIVGIIAVQAIPRFFDRRIFEARGFHDETLGLLRYAQKAAVGQRRAVCVAFGANGATLSLASSAGSAACDVGLTGPNGQTPYQITAPTGIAYGMVPSDFYFDALGRASIKQTIQVAGAVESITVELETGYVHP